MNALLEEAGSLRLSGKFAEAEAAYRTAIANGAPTGEAYYGLGLAQRAGQKPQDALKAFEQATKDPAAPMDAFIDGGILVASAGRPDLAMQWIGEAARRFPQRYEPPYFLGCMLASAGRDSDALGWLRHASAISPQNPEVSQALVQSLRRLRQLPEARQETLRWVEAAPDDAAAHAALAHILLEENRPEEALPHAAEAARLAPRNPDAAVLTARTLVLLERLAEAKTELFRAKTLAPERSDIYVHLGNLLKIEGQMMEARAALHHALSLEPSNVEAFFELSEVTRFAVGDPAIAAMEKLSAAAKDRSPAQLHFALGKAYDDTNQAADAFRHFELANAREREARRYDETATLAALARLTEIFSRSALEAGQNRGFASDRPVFIVGMPRSGSTLVEQILASHPDVAAGGERLYLRQATDAVLAERESGSTFPENLGSLRPEDFTAIGERYIRSTSQIAAGRARMTDKVLANGLLAGLIHLALPGARIIHCVRDPLDTCLSCYMKSFGQRVPYSADLATLGRYHRAQAKLMEHWRSVLPAETFLEVRYEDVVADLETQARRIVDFCGLGWSDACLDFHKSDRAVNTASVAQVRQPIYSEAVGRWRRYAVQLQPLMAALKEEAV